MAARVYYYAESLSRTTSTTTDYSTVKVSLTFTPNANKTYAIFWSILVDGNIAELTKARLRNTTASVTLAENFHSSTADNTAIDPLGGVAVYTASGSPSSTTFEIQVASQSSSLTLGAQEASILALELVDSSDQWASSTGTTSTSSTSYSAKVTLGWTPGSTGDYLVIASGETQAVASKPKVRVSVNSTPVVGPFEQMLWQVRTSWDCYTSMQRLVSASGAQSVTLDICSATTAQSDIRNAYIVALRLSEFEGAYWAEDRTSHTSTSSTYADSASVTATPAAVAHVVLACGQTTTNASAVTTATGQKINAAGSDVGSAFAAIRGYNNYFTAWWTLRKRTESATSTTWKTQYARTVGSATSTSDEHVIAVLQLDSAGSGETAKTISVSGAGAVLSVKQTGKIVSAAGAGAVSRLKSVGKAIAASGTAAGTFVKQIAKKVAPAPSGAVSANKSAAKTVAAASTGSVSALTARALIRLISAASSSVVAVQKSVAKAVSIASAGTASAVKSVAKSKVASAAGTVTSSSIKVLLRTISATGAGAVTVGKIAGRLVAVSVSGASVAAVVKAAGKAVAATGAGACSTLKAVSKAVTSSVAFAASIVKSTSVRVSLSAVSAVSIAKIIFTGVYEVAVGVAASATAAVSKAASKRSSAAASAAVSVVRGRVVARVISAASFAAVSIVTWVGKRRWPIAIFNIIPTARILPRKSRR